MYQLIKKNV